MWQALWRYFFSKRVTPDDCVLDIGCGYGEFINALIQFTIIAFCLFLVIKAMNKLKKKEAAAPSVEPPAQEVLLREIRDALRAK